MRIILTHKPNLVDVPEPLYAETRQLENRKQLVRLVKAGIYYSDGKLYIVCDQQKEYDAIKASYRCPAIKHIGCFSIEWGDFILLDLHTKYMFVRVRHPDEKARPNVILTEGDWRDEYVCTKKD